MRTRKLPAAIIEEAVVLFHDTRLVDIDPVAHADFVIARVLDRGTMNSVRALVRLYGLPHVRRFLANGGAQRLSRRTTALWRAFFDLTEDACTPRSSARSKSRFWNA